MLIDWILKTDVVATVSTGTSYSAGLLFKDGFDMMWL